MSEIKARTCIKYVSAFCAVGAKRFAFIFSFIFFLTGIAEGYAQSRLLIAWDLPAVSGSTTSSVGSGFNDPSVLANNITLGSGITVNNNSTAWGGTSWTPSGTDPIANGTVNSDYISFRVTASASDRVTITGVSRLVIQVSGSGPKYWSLLYSSVNTDAAFAAPEKNFGPFEVTLPGTGSFNTEITTQLNAAIAALPPIVLEPTSIGYFRLVGWGGATGSGSGRIVSSNTGVIAPDFGIMGTSVVSNIPKSLVWNGASGDEWNNGVTTDLFWLNGSTSTYFNNGDSATFNGNALVSVVSTGVSTTYMTNSTSVGEIQTITGGSITCQLLMTKSGGGTLIFNPAVDVDQNIYELNQTGGTIGISQSAGDSNNNVLGGPRWTMASNTVFDMGNSSYEIIRQLTGFGTIQMTNVIASTNANNTNAFVANNDIHLRNTSNSIFGGSVQGVGQLTIDNGTITLTGTNTYTGGTWISNAATLRLSSQASLPAQTQKSVSDLGVDGLPYYTNGVFEVVDLRLSRAVSTGGVMGTLELDDSLVTSLILSNSIGSTRASDKFRVTAGTNTSYTLQLNGPINLMGNLSGYNTSDTPGSVILRGTNQIQEFSNGVILERAGRILINGAHCVYAYKEFETWAPITFLDTSGYARFGLAPEVTSEITLSNTIFAGTNITTANRHAAFLLSTNTVNGAPQVLRLAGLVTGVGGLRITSPGNGDMGDLYLSPGNSYEGGTRIGTGKLFVPSADALGNGFSLKPASVAFIRFETRSDSYLVATDNIDFPTSHSIAITDDAMANIDTGANNVVLQGFITNSSSTNLVGGSLRKVGAGNLILSGAKYYTGPTRITEGVLEIAAPASLPANGPVQFGPLGSLKLSGAGSYGVGNISPVVITNSTGSTNTETMNGVLNLATSGVNVTVSQLSMWPNGSRLTVANLTNGSVTLPTSINNTPSQLAMIKSAENPTYVASVASDGLLSFAPANLKLTPTITVTPGSYTYTGSIQGPGVNEVSTGGSTGGVTLSYAGTGSTSYGSSATPPINAGTYTLTATVAADSTYNQASSLPTAFTIAKATPTVSVAPTASAVTVGALLSSSTLSGGTASVAGTFAWTTSSAVVNSTASYPVTFTPTDGANYNTASSTASVTANPAGTTFGSWSGNAVVTQDLVSKYAFGAADKNSAAQKLSSSITSTTLSLIAVVRTDDPTHLVITPKSVSSLSGTWSATESIISVDNAADQTGLGTGLVRRIYSVERGIDSKRFLKLEAVYTP